MKTCLALTLIALTSFVRAVDTTPPTLKITHTWMEKVGSVTHFKMYLDPQDETGLGQVSVFNTLWFRSALNTSTIPASNPWQVMPWKRSEPFDLPFNCTSCVIELKVQDSSGNFSAVQSRYFASPFPYSPAPNLTPQLTAAEQLGVKERYSGSAANLRGLFCGRFDGVSSGDDLLQVDRATGNIMVRRQVNGQPVKSDVSFSLAADTIEDSISADFDTDSRADLAIIASGVLTVYHNDGLDGSGVVQFGAQTINTAGTGITVFKNLATGDINGDGKLDIIVTGTDGSANPRVGWLIANASWQYDSSDGVPAPAGSTPGKLAVGDMNGDGTLDVVTVDAANNQMIVFKNKGTALAGDGDMDTNYQPMTFWTGLGQAGPNPAIPFIFAPVKALAIGDVTGDGRPDIITVFSVFNYDVSANDGHVFQEWRLYENRGSEFRPFGNRALGQSAQINAPTGPPPGAEDIPCDVMLQDLNEDRFPEMFFTNYYGNSVKIIRFVPLLDNVNLLTTLDDGSGRPELDEQDYVPVPATGDSAYAGPSRLARGKLYSNAKINSIAMAFATSDKVCWEQNVTRASSKTYDVQGVTFTDSDATGTEGANGLRAYTAFVGEKITTSLIATNNSAAALSNVFLDVTYPSNCSLDTSYTDPGWSTVTISGVKYVRWTVSIPAGSIITKNYRMTILSGTVGSAIAATGYLKATTTLTSAAIPKVTIKDPVQFRNTVETQSDNSGGDTAHAEEWIAYRMRMTNLGNSSVTTNSLLFTMPSNTTHLDHSADSVLGVTPEVKVGTTIYSPWKPNATIALNQKVIGSNNHIFQCTANGISGLTEPGWNLASNGLTNDGPVVWKHVGTTEPAISTLTWKGFDLAPGDDKTVEVRVKIKAGLANGTKITRSTISFTRSDGTKQSAPSGYITTLLNPLEITLSQDKTIARPGEIVRCTFTVHNWAAYDLGNCKVVDVVPAGMVFVESGASDGADSGVSGGTGNFNQFPGIKKINTSLTSNPSLDVLGILTWNLGTVPSRVTRTIVFDLQVQHDVPDSYNYGTSHPTMDIANFSYNFVGNNTLGKRLFAITPTLGTTQGSVQTAASLYLVGANTAKHTLLSGDDPIDAPRLYLIKLFNGTVTRYEGGETKHYLINDPGVTTDAFGTFTFALGNQGAGDARNVVLRDYIPTGMVFAGSFIKFTGPVTNFSGWHFYDAANKELLPGEAFTDTNGNGFFDVGEPYTDANNNKKFDGITASLVRWMDIPAGDLVGGSHDPLGSGGIISYRVQATITSGLITSTAGGMSGVKDGVSYTPITGYHVRADNLRFPINGSPEQVKISITPPATSKFPVGVVRSRPFGQDADVTEFTIPYEVTGAVGITLSDMYMEFDIPKGYRIPSAVVENPPGTVLRSYSPGAPGNTITVTTNASGVTHLKYPLDGQRIAFPKVQVAVDPATKSALLTNGVTTKGLTFQPIITGKYIKPASPPPAQGAARSVAAAPPPSPITLASATTFGSLPVVTDSTKDSRIFVGRTAPISVRKGAEFDYVIFVGNLTNVPLDTGTITMKVPEGCEALSATRYTFNNNFNATDVGGRTGKISPATPSPQAPTNGTYDQPYASGNWTRFTWKKPLTTGTTVTWTIGSLISSEGGVVSLRVHVLDSFTGSRIDDNSCIFDVLNACAKTPGPVGVAVLSGNETASSASVQERALDGLQIRNSTAVTSLLSQSFSLGSSSTHITFGGADVMQLRNGIGMVPLPGDRVLTVGPPASINASDIRLLLDTPTLRVAAGPGNLTDGVKLIDVPSFTLGTVNAMSLMTSLNNTSANIVAGGGGNIVAGGGGNIVAAGGGNVQNAGADAKVIISLDANGRVLVDDLVTGGAKLVGQDGAGIVAAGGGNIVAAGGGNIVAAGGGNLVGQDAAGIVAAGGGNLIGKGGAGLIGQDGAAIVAGGGGNLITVHSGNLIQGNGLTQGLGK